MDSTFTVVERGGERARWVATGERNECKTTGTKTTVDDGENKTVTESRMFPTTQSRRSSHRAW